MIEFTDKQTQNIIRVVAAGFQADVEEEEDYVEGTYDEFEDDDYLDEELVSENTLV